MKLVLLLLLSSCSFGLFGQSKLIVSYIHHLVNFQLSREVNVAPQDPFYVKSIKEHSPIGFNACYNRQIRFSAEWVFTYMDYAHTFTFPEEYKLSKVQSAKTENFFTRFKTFRFSGSYKVYSDRKYSTWLGISVSLYHNTFIKSDRFYARDYLVNDGFVDENFYTKSLTIEKSGARRLWVPSVFARHIISFPRREFIFTTGVQIMPRQKLNVNYIYSTATSTVSFQEKQVIRPSALLYFNFSLSRKLKFKHGDGRLNRILGIDKNVE